MHAEPTDLHDAGQPNLMAVPTKFVGGFCRPSRILEVKSARRAPDEPRSGTKWESNAYNCLPQEATRRTQPPNRKYVTVLDSTRQTGARGFLNRVSEVQVPPGTPLNEIRNGPIDSFWSRHSDRVNTKGWASHLADGASAPSGSRWSDA
jgi:hypothetical protein